VWFLRFLKENKVQLVISDNRYGLHTQQIPSILITHQLHLFSGFGKLSDSIARFFLYKWINKFTECWIPDFNDTPNLAGRLSHPKTFPDNTIRYLGSLSRLEPCASSQEKTEVLILLSGPEPQRSILENKILGQLQDNRRKIVLVRGLPESNAVVGTIPGVKIFNHAGTHTLNELICGAELVISRSGYSSVMDMVKLKKKMVVIPTPGQSEQEYLGRHLSVNRIAVVMDQNEFSIEEAIKKSAAFDYAFPVFNMQLYKEVIKGFIASRFSL
jgi:UDP-N-acetylglucosamine transferase subunit ALG13